MYDPIERSVAVAARSQVEALVGLPASTVEAVARRGAQDAKVDVDLIGDFLDVVLEAARQGRRIPHSALNACRLHGEEAADRGVALAAVLDLYLSSAWRLWGEIQHRAPKTSAATVATVAATLFRAADDAAEALAAGFEVAQRRSMRFEESLRRQFIEGLLGGGGNPDLLRERAAHLGFNLAGGHLVLAARNGHGVADAGQLLARVEGQVLAKLGGRDVVIATKESLLVCVFPVAEQDPTPELLAALVDVDEGPWRIGVGQSYAGATGVARSFGEALQALELSDRGARPSPIAYFNRLLADRLLTADPRLAAELVETVLGPLERSRGGAEPLVATLEAHFATSGNTTATARSLGLSPRAVVYRLARITDLTGYSPTEPNDRFVLEMAIRCRRLAFAPVPDPPQQPATDGGNGPKVGPVALVSRGRLATS